MSQLVPPHGSPELKPLLLEGKARDAEVAKAKAAKPDLIMAICPDDARITVCAPAARCRELSLPDRSISSAWWVCLIVPIR